MVRFIAARGCKQIDELTVEDITADRVRFFLQDLEQMRGCSGATRNQRLAVVHALARFIAEHSPEHIEWCGTLGTIPFKRAMKREITIWSNQRWRPYWRRLIDARHSANETMLCCFFFTTLERARMKQRN